jgi:hypothetical protein
MDFWNDDIAFIMQKKWKMWTQKVCHNITKMKWNNKPPSNEELSERERETKESTTGGGSRSLSSLQHQVCAY